MADRTGFVLVRGPKIKPVSLFAEKQQRLLLRHRANFRERHIMLLFGRILLFLCTSEPLRVALGLLDAVGSLVD